MRGNFVIGIIVFGILIIVNFVVITKGSGRIAEVAARFTLDAMPGKQMAIDADLVRRPDRRDRRAKTRRKELEDESSFFGAMDGASKFVRGDAIAGLLITFINVIGGMIIGVGQQGLSFADAANNYTLLTVGDGLVSQIPALIVSTAAGLLVSKAGVSGSADKRARRAVHRLPQGAGHVIGRHGADGLHAGHADHSLPGAMSAGAGYLAFRSARMKRAAKDQEVAEELMPGTGSGRAARGSPDLRQSEDRRPQARTRLRPAQPGQGRRNGDRPADRTDQGAAAPAGPRSRLRHAAGAHSRQHAARAEPLQDQDQGGGGRRRPGLRRSAHGHGPHGQPDYSARRAHHRADLRPARDLDRPGHARRGRGQRLFDHRPLDGRSRPI